MKKLLLTSIFFLIIFNISCLRNSSSKTSDLVANIDGKIHYYKLCNNSYICRYSCTTEDISSLTYQNINRKCSTEDFCFSTCERSKCSNEIKTNFIDLIMEVDTLNVVKSISQSRLEKINQYMEDNKLKEEEDNNNNSDGDGDSDGDDDNKLEAVSQYISSNRIEKSHPRECPKNQGIAIKWAITKKDSDTIYQRASEEDSSISRLQWSQILGKMDYQKAKETCENYEFRSYSDWRLPSSEELKKIAIEQLGEIFKISPEELFWSSTEADNGQIETLPLRGEEIPDPTLKNKNDSLSTICVRNYK